MLLSFRSIEPSFIAIALEERLERSKQLYSLFDVVYCRFVFKDCTVAEI